MLRSREARRAWHARSLLLLSICQPPVGRAPVPGVGRRCWQNPLQSPRLQGLCPMETVSFWLLQQRLFLRKLQREPPHPSSRGCLSGPHALCSVPVSSPSSHQPCPCCCVVEPCGHTQDGWEHLHVPPQDIQAHVSPVDQGSSTPGPQRVPSES